MAYEMIEELPTQVRLSLDENDQRHWMDEYNNSLKEGLSVADAKKSAWHSVETNPSSFSFAIIASVECIDSDGEVVDIDSIRNHLDDMIERGGVSQEEHGNYTISTVWDWDDYTDPKTKEKGVVVYGNMFGGDRIYEEARQEFLNGMNKMSVGGDASYGGYQCDEKGCYIRRNVEQLAEISLCHTPANPKSALLWFNKNAIAKTKKKDDSIHLMVKSIKAHPSCPFCEIRKNIIHDGIVSTKITKKGVRVITKDAKQLFAKAHSNGYFIAKANDDEYLVSTMAKATEMWFKTLYRDKMIDRHGRLFKTITKDRFVALGVQGLLFKSGGYFYLDNSNAVEPICKKCPDGYHQHYGNGDCHPISMKHRDGSKAQIAHDKKVSRAENKENKYEGMSEEEAFMQMYYDGLEEYNRMESHSYAEERKRSNEDEIAYLKDIRNDEYDKAWALHPHQAYLDAKRREQAFYEPY